MEYLQKKEGQYYISKTSMGVVANGTLFTEGIVVRADNFRVATEEEVRMKRLHEEGRNKE